MQRRFNGKSLWPTQSSAERECEWVCVCVCMSAHFHCVLVNLIDCTATTWAFYSHYDFDEHFTNHKA